MKTIGTLESIPTGNTSELLELATGEIVSQLPNGQLLPVADNLSDLEAKYGNLPVWELHILLDYLIENIFGIYE
jgi:hypothetical protein